MASGELLTKGLGMVRAAASATAGGVPADRLSLLSPVTTPCRVVAQAVNYRGHARETGFGEDPPAVFNPLENRTRDVGGEMSCHVLPSAGRHASP